MSKKSKSLKSSFIRSIIVICIIAIFLSISIIYYTLNGKINDLSTKFALQYALKEKSRISAPIDVEIALINKMVETPVIREWAQNENNKQLKEKAINELESYRDNFLAENYFFIIDESKNYYFNNKKNEYEGNQYRYTLDKDNEEDKWYFATMEKVDDYSFNVNYDRELKKTKLWIDAIVYSKKGEKVGMAGTGLSLDSFIKDFLQSNNEFITPLLFDRKGYIRAYQDTNLIHLSTIDIEFSDEEEKTIFNLLREEDKDSLRSTMDNLSRNPGEVFTVKLNMENKERIAVITYVSPMDWYMMSLVDTSEIFSMWDFLPTIAVLVISTLIIVAIIVFFINNSILRPINNLTNHTEIIADGNYDQKVEMSYDNEFGTLADSFNKMIDTIKKHTNHLEEMVDQRTQKLQESNEKLSTKNKKIMDNINYAQYIQESVLPANEKINDCLKEYFVIWRPRDLVGGDFYWIKRIDDKVLIAVIDCTGHGVPGALMTMTTNSILNSIVDCEKIKEPSKVLRELNVNIKDTLHGQSQNPQMDDGLDMGLCCINKKSRRIIFSGAKISLYYNDEGGIVRIKGDRESIGYQRSEKDYDFSNNKLKIKDNRTFYMTTDGYLDQNGEEQNKRYGRKRFIETLGKIYEKSLDEQKNYLIEELENHAGSEPQRDDITVMGFKL